MKEKLVYKVNRWKTSFIIIFFLIIIFISFPLFRSSFICDMFVSNIFFSSIILFIRCSIYCCWFFIILFFFFSWISRFFFFSSLVAFNFALLCVLNALTYVRSACNPSFRTHEKKNLLRYNTHNTHRWLHMGPDACADANTNADVQLQFPFHGPLKFFFLLLLVFSLLPVSNPPADWPPIKFEHKWRKARKNFNFKTVRKPFGINSQMKEDKTESELVQT